MLVLKLNEDGSLTHVPGADGNPAQLRFENHRRTFECRRYDIQIKTVPMMILEEPSMHRLVSNFQPFSNELFLQTALRTDLPYGSKMKPMKVANSGVPDLWTESVENGYYIVPYYFLDEKGNEHTVTVYL